MPSITKTFNSNPYTGYFNWCRAGYYKDKDVIDQLQDWVTCKDYIVDTFMKGRNLSSFFGYNASKEVLDSNWILFAYPHSIEVMEKNLAIFTQWEVANGFKPATYILKYLTDKKLTLVAFNFDDEWRTNNSILSLYFSMLRQVIVTGGTTFTKDGELNRTNEDGYHKQYNFLNSRAFIKLCFNNPRYCLEIMKNAPDYDHNTGFLTELRINPGHGITGLFYWIAQWYNESYDKPILQANPSLHNIWAFVYTTWQKELPEAHQEALDEKIKRELPIEVPKKKVVAKKKATTTTTKKKKVVTDEMQSVQPKVKRPRVKKTAVL